MEVRVRGQRLFRWIWRADAVLLLLVAIFFVVTMSVALVAMLVEMHRDARRTTVVKVADQEIDRKKATFGDFEPVAGTSVLRASLADERDAGLSSSGQAAVRNYLFYDPTDGSSRWLLPGNKNLVVATREMPEESTCGTRKQPVAGVVYQLVEADSNGDGKLSESDVKVVAVSTPSGLRLTRVLGAVEEVKGTSWTADNRILVLYTAASTLKAALIDGTSFAVLRNEPITPQQQSR
jgi:hypothetical protein